MFEEEAFASVLNEGGEFPTRFPQDGAPAHYSIRVREFLDQQFPGHWIGRRGPVEWPARSPGIIKRVFVDWVKRLNLYIENNGGHRASSINKSFCFAFFIFFL
jgi:hypothetical protein